MGETRDFHIGDIIAVLTDRLVSPDGLDGVWRLLDWMTGDALFNHQIPRATEECGPRLAEQHPDLATVAVPDDLEGEAAVLAWLAKQAARFGETRPVARLDADDHTRIDPITELRMIRPDMPIIAVDSTPGETGRP